MSLKLKKNSKKNPRNGWRYTTNDIEFTGDSISEVVKKVSDFRELYQFEHTDVEQEILQELQKTDPWMVEKDLNPREPYQPIQKSPVEKWIETVFLRPGSFYDNNVEIKRRRDACMDCPYREQSEMSETFQKWRYITTGGRADPKLGTCSYYGWDNSLATVLKHPKPINTKETPDNCWRGDT